MTKCKYNQNVIENFNTVMGNIAKEFCINPEFYKDKKDIKVIFLENYITVSQVDAADFLSGFYRWTSAGALLGKGYGRYQTLRPGAQWYPFRTKSKNDTNIEIVLRPKYIIKLAVLERLYMDLKWDPCLFSHDEPWKPASNSKNRTKWPLDIVGYHPDTGVRAIGCEIRAERSTKKKDGIDDFLDRILKFGLDLSACPGDPQSEDANTLATLGFLREKQIPFFVAAGPDCYRRIFKMDYSIAGKVLFNEVSENDFRKALALEPTASEL